MLISTEKIKAGKDATMRFMLPREADNRIEAGMPLAAAKTGRIR